MSPRRPSISIRNTRKHYLKCVDCGTQTLPQNASGERPWTTAAALGISGRVNDGGLCFKCGNKRRVLLGLPVELDNSETLKNTCDRPVTAGPIEATLKRIRINKREHAWEVSTIHSLLLKWKDQYAYDEYKHREMDLKKWVVRVNERQIPPDEYSSLAVGDGDEISILSGALLHPF
jgi:hypothetical protein